MASILRPFAALYAAMLLLSMGLGLLATFLSLRLSVDGFSALTTGMILTSYFIGSVAGTFYCIKIIRQVGHIRAFAAFSAIATAMVMLHGFYMSAVSWAIFRFFTGFATIGLFMVIESWLNECSEEMTAIGDRWREIALIAGRIFKGREGKDESYIAAAEILLEIAEREEKVYRKLKEIKRV